MIATPILRGALSCGILRFSQNRAAARLVSSSKSFSSSPPPPRKEPRLSARNQRDVWILASGICGFFGYYLYHKDTDWDTDVRSIQRELIESSKIPPTGGDNAQLHFSSNLPVPVKRYIQQTFLPLKGPQEDDWQRYNNNPPKILTVQQSGEFLASQKWYPFEARMMAVATTRTPGFAWDATTSIWNVPTNVLEYCISHNHDETNGRPTMERKIVTKVWGKYPLFDIQEDDPYILFWLAMTPLFPIVFLPQPVENVGILQWNNEDTLSTDEHDRASAQLRLEELDATVGAEFLFSKTDGLLYQIRIAASEATSQQPLETWQATYSNYQEHLVELHPGEKPQTIRIPSTIEIGKKGENEQYRAQFRIQNHRLHYKQRWAIV